MTMELDEIYEDFPKFESLNKYTSIRVEQNPTTLKVIDEIQRKFSNKMEFIPPLFTEYVIELGLSQQDIRQAFYESVKQREPYLSVHEQRRKAERLINSNKVLSDETLLQKYLIRWHDEITFTVLIYINGKKKLYIMCRYEYNVSDLTHLYFDVIIMSDEFKREKRTRGDEWFQTFCQRQIFFVLAIADFMLNYTDKVQYETISYTPKESSQTTVSKKVSSKTKNIVLKSKKKKYIITEKDTAECKKRQYRKIKSSWFVRGYYQRFGKEKKIKYIPPRINHRKVDGNDKPAVNKYIID